MSNVVNLAKYAEAAYMSYTKYVVGDRAIPNLKDGQKPVQRRILWAMNELKLSSDKSPKKCARIVGDVIGKFHPHGDSATYETLVKMTQDFYLRYPLINGQGNFGTIDGDSAAAMRYTEAKLTPISELLLSELKMNGANFINNYDDSMTEPDILPSRLNFMLMNGTFGIAVALSTNIPSHNIRNVTDATVGLIRNPNLTTSEIVEHIKAPDYPTGGQLINTKEEIINNYEKGEGLFTLRCRWKVEKLARGQYQIVVYEFPPSSSPEKLYIKCGAIDKPKTTKDKNGKVKKITAKQLSDKQYLNNLISNANDESSEESGNRVVLEPRSSRDNPEDIMNALYKFLDLEENVKMNMVSIGNNNKACQKNLKGMLQEWIDFRMVTITRRTQYSYDKASKRIHILEGRKIAYANLENIINIIKSAEDPKSDLMTNYSLSEIQANDILDIRLRQLANIELHKIESELELLLKEFNKLEALLNSKTKMKNLMIKEIESDTTSFEDERKTLIQESNKSTLSTDDKVLDEKVTIVVTQQGWLIQRKGHNVDLSTLQLKDGDNIFKILEGRSVLPIAILSDKGRVFNLKTNSIPTGKTMSHINSLIENDGEKITDVIVVTDSDKYLVSSSDGYGFITESKNFVTKNKAGKAFFKVTDDSTIFKLQKIDDTKYISCLSEDFRLLSYEISEINNLPKGKGVQLIKLPNNIKLKEVWIHNEVDVKISYESGINNVSLIDEDILSKRSRRGKNVKENVLSISD
jgi:topoisomerase-4 subunit A